MGILRDQDTNVFPGPKASGPPKHGGALARFRLLPCLGLWLVSFAAHAELAGLPAGAMLVAEASEPLAKPVLAAGPWESGAIPSVAASGYVKREAWQVVGTSLSTEQLLDPVQAAFAGQGFLPVFACRERTCGGFEFRYGLDLLSEPAMHVDLGDFRYLLMSRGKGKRAEYVALVVSRARQRGFVHVTRLEPAQAAPEEDVPRVGSGEGAAASGSGSVVVAEVTKISPAALVQNLLSKGHVGLSDLRFATGSSQLDGTSFDSLDVLSDWLKRNPKKRIVLVGHTDNDGSLAGNMELSRKRAQAVREALRTGYGIAGDRMEAEGVGFLAPLVSNDSEAGRLRNRRVEAVLAEDS